MEILVAEAIFKIKAGVIIKARKCKIWEFFTIWCLIYINQQAKKQNCQNQTKLWSMLTLKTSNGNIILKGAFPFHAHRDMDVS